MGEFQGLAAMINTGYGGRVTLSRNDLVRLVQGLAELRHKYEGLLGIASVGMEKAGLKVHWRGQIEVIKPLSECLIAVLEKTPYGDEESVRFVLSPVKEVK